MPDTPARRPDAVRFGLAAAMTLAVLQVLGFLYSPVNSLGPAIGFVCAAIGLWKGNAWSAYGGGLFLLSLSAGLIVGQWRTAGQFPTLLLGSLAFASILAAPMFLAGRALGARWGRSAAAWIAVSVATLLWLGNFKAYVVPSVAMENTLEPGDYLYVRLAGPFYTPARGDTIVLRYPVDPKQIFIKRVVAVGGDRVRLRDKALIVNGAVKSEPFAIHSTTYVDPFRDNFPAAPNVNLPGEWSRELASYVVDGDLRVPPGKYFVLGDNRDDSLDSRYWGFVDRADIVGTPVLIYFSEKRPAEGVSRAQTIGIPIILTPGRVRWDRLFRPVS